MNVERKTLLPVRKGDWVRMKDGAMGELVICVPRRMGLVLRCSPQTDLDPVYLVYRRKDVEERVNPNQHARPRPYPTSTRHGAYDDGRHPADEED